MQCYRCDLEAEQECPRCGALYCDNHGDALCERCMDPAQALPSYRVYRGSLVALLIGSVFAVWLLVLPPVGADQDSPGFTGALPTPSTGTPAPAATVAPGGTSTPAPGEATPTAGPTGTPEPTASPTETPEPEPDTIEYTVVSGDSLLLIAQNHLPAGREVNDFADEIAALNGITDPASINIGDVLEIPTS